MTSTAPSALRGTAPSSTAANTAPVHEFRCLYTHDLRRKQKRWQDGFLKFHTFNKRVMVYDQPRNYIGDTHWKGGETLYDGDELTLENGVIVQVAEPVATTQTDLTPLFEKRPRDAPERSAPGHVRLPQSRLPTPGVHTTGLTASVAPRHKPLSQLLGTPKGPHGRAVLPTRSPFEERQATLQKEDEWAASERAAKRRKVAEAEQTWSNARDARTPVPKPRESPAFGSSRTAQTTPLARKAPAGELIDLVSDVEEVEPQSDVTLPNTPPDFVRPPVRSMKKRTSVPQNVPELPQPPFSQLVSTTNKVVRVQEETELLEKAIKDDYEAPAEEDVFPKQSKKLRLITGSRPKMLLCQGAASQRRAEKSSRTGATEKRAEEQPARVARQNRVVVPPELDRRTKPPSEIRRLWNGFTPSSSPEEPELSEGPFPRPNDDVADDQRHQPAPTSKPNNIAVPIGKAPPEKCAQSAAEKTLSSKLAATVNRPNLQIQSVARQEPPSPRHFRRIRSENDKPLGKQSAVSKSFDGSGLPVGDDPREIVRGKSAKRPLQRSVSPNVPALRQQERENTPPSPIVDTDVGPWSTEAMDLFDWRPPGYVFRGQGKGFGPAEDCGARNVAAI